MLSSHINSLVTLYNPIEYIHIQHDTEYTHIVQHGIIKWIESKSLNCGEKTQNQATLPIKSEAQGKLRDITRKYKMTPLCASNSIHRKLVYSM